MLNVPQRPAAVAVLLLLGAVAFLATADPYIEYGLVDFIDADVPTSHVFAVGIATPPLLDYLVFDFAFTGELIQEGDAFTFPIAARFSGYFGTLDTYIKLGCGFSVDGGFLPFIKLKLSVPLFGWLTPSDGV